MRITPVTILLFICLVFGGCGTSSSDTARNVSGVPSAPTGVTSSAIGSSQVSVSWQPVSGATSYNLYWSAVSGVSVAGGSKIANVNSSYTQTGLNANTTYYYVVTAVNGNGESVPSSQTTVSTSADVPVAPTGISANGGSNQTTISWGAVSGAASYNIYWSTTSGVTKSNGTKITAGFTPYIHTGLTANTTYYYIVTSVNSAGESGSSSQATATTATVAGIAPGAPSGVSASGGTNQATISWGAVSGATSYAIYRSPLSGITRANGTKITGVTSPYRNTGLAAGTNYYYVITSLNASGESTESTAVSVVTAPLDGVALYAGNCSCHGGLATSSKNGRSAVVTQAAITDNRGGMGSLSTLSAAQVQAISDVLVW